MALDILYFGWSFALQGRQYLGTGSPARISCRSQARPVRAEWLSSYLSVYALCFYAFSTLPVICSYFVHT